MNKKLIFLVLLIGLSIPNLFGQFCPSPPTCLTNGGLEPNNPTATGNMNSGAPATINGWGVAHGTPSLTTGFTGRGVWMWGRTSSGVANGEGIFACYDFQSGHTYQVCFRVMNTSTNTSGNLFVRAVSGLATGGGSVIPTVPSTSQLIHSAHTHTSTWTPYSVAFTPNANYTGIWVYPFSAFDFINGIQYDVAVDDIWISEVQPTNITVTATPNPIGFCESTTLTVNGALSGSIYNWFPTTGLSSSTGISVTATPCQTTTYTVTIQNPCPNSTCLPLIQKQVTVTVDPTPTGNIINNTSTQCSSPVDLQYSGNPCPGATYSWTGPKNPSSVLSTGPNLYMPVSTPGDMGTYVLTITSPSGCVKTYNTIVTMNCCDAIADFDIVDCNPVRFINTTTSGNTNGVQGEWYWDFGDGTTSNIKNPSHLYTALLGTYTVCLTSVLYDGLSTCCSKVCKDVEVCDFTCDPKAAMDFRIINSVTGEVQLLDKSVGGGYACAWEWTVDGLLPPYTSQNPNVFLNSGTHHICLKVWFCQPWGVSCFEEWCEDIEIP